MLIQGDSLCCYINVCKTSFGFTNFDKKVVVVRMSPLGGEDNIFLALDVHGSPMSDL